MELERLQQMRISSRLSEVTTQSEVDDNGDMNRSLLDHGPAIFMQTSKESLARKRAHHDPEAPKNYDLRASALDATQEKSRYRRRSFQKGWRAGVAASAIMTTVILIINLTLTVWASLSFEIVDGIGNAYVGECSIVNTWSTVLHIFINVLSSAMLSASNYTMQCLTAPTRKECDTAHAHQRWLDIGVPSLRNLCRIRWSRRIAWSILALSGIPIHLLYNSAVFKQLDNNSETHNAVIISPPFLRTTEINFSAFPAYQNETLTWNINGTNISRDATEFWGADTDHWYTSELSWYQTPVASQLHDAYMSDPSAFDKINPQDCFKMYGASLLSGHSHVLVVLNESTTYDNVTDLDMEDKWHKLPDWSVLFPPEADLRDMPYYWPCEENCQIDSRGAVQGIRYNHCLAKRVKSNCKLQFSVQVLVVVLLCNAAKSVFMLFTLWRHREETLLTFGDAIASYLDRPDDLTNGRCLASRSNLEWTLPDRSIDLASFLQARTTHEDTALISPHLQRWRAAVSTIRWRTAITLCSAVIITAIALVIQLAAESSITWNLDTIKGFGAVRPDSVLNTNLPKEGSVGLMSVLLVTNAPQLIVTSCYLLYNGLFTSMLLACEYSGYAKQRKSLRVTTPKGTQRSTYWLQLPYAYSIPLIVASATLHWLVSQSIFLARIVTFIDEEGNGGKFDIKRFHVESADSQVGFSILPMVAAIVLAACMLLAVVGMGRRELESSMPVAASCSFALAAAAHRPKEDVDASVLPIMWGEVEEMGNQDVGHCCFTSHEVMEMVPWRKYA